MGWQIGDGPSRGDVEGYAETAVDDDGGCRARVIHPGALQRLGLS